MIKGDYLDGYVDGLLSGLHRSSRKPASSNRLEELLDAWQAEPFLIYRGGGARMHKELVVSLKDLRYVSIACPHCRTVVILDMQERSSFGENNDYFCPKQCPGCQTTYDTAIQPGIDGFQKCYKKLSTIADRVSFRGEPEDATGDRQ